MGIINDELKANTRMNNTLIRNELYRVIAYSMAVRLSRRGVDVNNLSSFYSFAKTVAETVNDAIADSKLTRNDRIEMVAEKLESTFDKLGMNFSSSSISLVSESLVDRFGRGADPATAEDIAVFFGADLIGGNIYDVNDKYGVVVE
jgi:hypothetical protein